MKLEHVLLTTDLSEEAMRPFGPVVELAKSMNARVTVLNVVQDVPIAPHGAPLAPPMSAPHLERDIDAARSALRDQCAENFEGVDLHMEVIGHSSPAKAIVEYADHNGVDLIALSTHGRTGFRHLAFGSVAEAVLRHSQVPVLTFPRAERGEAL